jgi:mono/diheme cytochrome c family protein
MMLRGFVVGIVVAIVVAVGVTFFAISNGLIPANADGKPSRFERWAARVSLRATLRREAPKAPNPLPSSEANIEAGIKLYGENCIVCHGARNHVPTNIAAGLFQRPPQLARDGVEDDPDGVVYWKIAHGIRYTGMPAFVNSLSDEQIWQLVLFLKNMSKLPSHAQRAWDELRNPVTLAPARPASR